MALINRVEIYYFRSIHRTRLGSLRRVNVFSGRNDAGKSNVLKALNLFFNYDTDWGRDFDFSQDFSRKRMQEVRSTVKGKQFVSVAVTFNRPKRYDGSLPETFRVKRTWYRDSDTPTQEDNLDTAQRHNQLPSTYETARRFLPQLLNRIHFEYVPAVKSRLYFDHLLSRLQRTLLDVPTEEDTVLANTADELAAHIQDKVGSLQDDFERATSIRSTIVPPGELAGLFQAFKVSTDAEPESLPLMLRGDGIQARYVASVLHYISSNSNDFFIWGFEEPENSLEYSHVIQLAEDFEKQYSSDAQIFVTTHSPAFTSLRADDTACFRVSKDEGASEVRQVWPEEEKVDERVRLNLEMGFMKIQEGLHEDYLAQQEQLKELQDARDRLLKEAEEQDRPFLLTEGRHDVQILQTAWTKRRDGDPPFRISAADPAVGENGGSGGAGTLSKMIETMLPDMGTFIALFDRDDKGIKRFEKLSNYFQRWEGNDDIKRHVNGAAFAMLLPVPQDRAEYAERRNLPLEYYFPNDILARTTNAGHGLEFETDQPVVLVGGERFSDVGEEQLEIPWEQLRRISGGKKVFAEDIVPSAERDDFRNFDLLFETVEAVIEASVVE